MDTIFIIIRTDVFMINGCSFNKRKIYSCVFNGYMFMSILVSNLTRNKV